MEATKQERTEAIMKPKAFNEKAEGEKVGG